MHQQAAEACRCTPSCRRCRRRPCCAACLPPLVRSGCPEFGAAAAARSYRALIYVVSCTHMGAGDKLHQVAGSSPVTAGPPSHGPRGRLQSLELALPPTTLFLARVPVGMGDPRTPRAFLGRQAPARTPQRLCLASAALMLIALALAVRGPPSACLWGLGRASASPTAAVAAAEGSAAATPASVASQRGAPPTSVPPEEVPRGCQYLERAW